MKETGQLEESVKHNSKLADDISANLGDNHSLLFEVQNNLISTYLKLEKHEEGIKIGEKCLKLQEDAFGKNHSELLATLIVLTECYEGKGDYENALKAQKHSEVIYAQTFGKDSPGLSKLQNNIAGTLLKLKRGEEALDMFEKIEKEMIRQYGKEHPTVFTVKSNKAMVYAGIDKYAEAAHVFKEVETYEQNHRQSSLSTRREMLRCYVAAKHLTQAAEVYSKVAGKGQENFDMTIAKNNYAIALLGAKKFADALKVFKEVESIMEAMKMPATHPALLNTKQNIGTTYQHLGKQDDAGKMFAYVKQMKELKI